eukprot:Skav231612  [mRNA]  locus=scaffold2184:20994:21915:- [translate_table: standard]
MKIPKVIILLVLLISWMEDPAVDTKQDIQVIEYFAGAGRIAQLSERVGYRAVGYDLEYGKKAAHRSGKRNPLDLNSNAGMVLAIKLILRSSFNDLVGLFAVCCSSFVPINRGTGDRDILVPEGIQNSSVDEEALSFDMETDLALVYIEQDPGT